MSNVLSNVSLDTVLPALSGVSRASTPATLPVQPSLAPPTSQGDTVKLSVTQQVRNLRSEGEGTGQIATSLGLTAGQVSNDLYVTLTWPQLLSKVASASLTLSSNAAAATEPAVSAVTPASADAVRG